MKELEWAAELIESTGSPWAICGGWAIDLFLGRITRMHKDVDVAIPRQHQLQVQARLLALGWSLEVAHKGELSPWAEGDFLELPRHAIWARRGDEFLEILLNEWTETEIVHRRDRRISLPVDRAICRNGKIAFLAPELVLLYKSTDTENKLNRRDLAVTLPELTADSRLWLSNALKMQSPEHPWLLGELGRS